MLSLILTPSPPETVSFAGISLSRVFFVTHDSVAKDTVLSAGAV